MKETRNVSTQINVNWLNVLTLLFIALKLTGHIDWSWWYVVLPTIINFGIAVILGIVILILEMRWW